VTEGTGHVIDPAGDARRALQDAVTSHGPEVLSDATVMDHLCRTQLAALPGESILIVSAARADVPALLRDAIPQFGNYGAIQSVASTLAQASDLDGAASLWVVREFARALGLIAPGGTQSMPRTAPGGTGAEAPGAAVATGEVGAGAAVTAGMSAGGAGAGTGGGTGGPGGPDLAGGPQPGMAGGPQPGMGGGPQPGVAGGPQPGMGGGPQPAGGPAPRGSSGSKLFTRNTVGIAAAIALVAGYLGVAAVAHLSPFPAKTVAATSSESAGTGPSTSPATTPATSPATSPAGTPDASPTSDYEVLLSKIPAAIQGRDNCHLTGTQYGATAVSQCSRLSLPAGTIIYYLYPSQAALSAGLSTFLASVHFKKQRECTTGNDFTDFLTECRTQFHNQTPFMTGSIAEYTSTSNDPIIASTDNQQNVMAVLVGTNPGDLLSYWKQLTWIKD
jgi:hypothetical protein